MEENVELVTAGCCNLVRHIENSSLFGVPVVVGVNQFATDTEAEMNAVKQAALDAGAAPPQLPCGALSNDTVQTRACGCNADAMLGNRCGLQVIVSTHVIIVVESDTCC